MLRNSKAFVLIALSGEPLARNLQKGHFRQDAPWGQGRLLEEIVTGRGISTGVRAL